MTSPARKLLEEALALPEDERLELGEALLASVEAGLDADTRDAVLRRAEEIATGAVIAEPWTEVLDRIRRARRE